MEHIRGGSFFPLEEGQPPGPVEDITHIVFACGYQNDNFDSDTPITRSLALYLRQYCMSKRQRIIYSVSEQQVLVLDFSALGRVRKCLPEALQADICATAQLYIACRCIEHASTILNCLVDVFNSTNYLDRNCVAAVSLCGYTLRQPGQRIEDLVVNGGETFFRFLLRLTNTNSAGTFRLQYQRTHYFQWW